jgi:hypothetical protein
MGASPSRHAGAGRPRPGDRARAAGRRGKALLRVAVLAALAGGAFLAAYGLTKWGSGRTPDDGPPGMGRYHTIRL